MQQESHNMPSLGKMQKPFWLLFAALVSAGFIYARFFEPHLVKVSETRIVSERLETAERPIRLVHISDLHLSGFSDYERLVIDKVNSLQPDLICITGDFFKHSRVLEEPNSATFKRQAQAIQLFANALAAPHGVYAVRGNHDFSNDKETSNLLLEMLASTGVTVLADQSRQAVVHGATLWLAGVDFPEDKPQSRACFAVAGDSAESWLRSGPSNRNSYAHLHRAESAPEWYNYRFSGRFRLSGEATAIGVTFYSQMHRGWDRFYRLRNYAGHPSLHLSAHGTRLDSEKSADTGVVPEKNRWYRFIVIAETESLYTRIAAKVWPQDLPEPLHWQAEATDTSSTRIRGGTIGVWSAHDGEHDFDDLVVQVGQNTVATEDFSSPQGTWVSYNFHHQALPALLAGREEKAFCLFLSHTPDLAVYTRGLEVDLVLSGHTHGGQLQLPFIGSPVVRIGMGRRYMEGFHDLGYTRLKVNRGIGTVHLPLRFNSPPEIALIELCPAR